MRLINIPIIILLLIGATALLFPILMLTALGQVLSDDIWSNTGQSLRSDIWFNTGQSLAGLSSVIGRYDNAAGLYGELIRKHPNSINLYIEEGNAFKKAKDWQRALDAYNKVLELDQGDPVYLFERAKIFVYLKEWEKAEPIFEEILKAQTDDPAAIGVIGDVAIEKGDYLKGYREYSRKLELMPNDGMTLEKKGDVIFALLTIPTAGKGADETFRNQDLLSEGEACYQKAIELLPDRSNIIREKMAIKAKMNPARSIAELEKRNTQYRYAD